MYYNNPVEIAESEWRLIWGSSLCSHPDVLLSLGTGHDPQKRERPTQINALKRGLYRETKHMFKMAADRMHDALDCEKAWNEHIRHLPDAISRSRFFRYSPALAKSLPTLDDIDALPRLQDAVRKDLECNVAQFQRLAMQLVASSFYFEHEKIQQRGQVAATVTGRSYVDAPIYKC
jgi:hypothetical protein